MSSSSSSSSRNGDDDDDDDGVITINGYINDMNSDSKSDDVSTNSTGNEDSTSIPKDSSSTPKESGTKSTPPPKKKASWLKRLFSKSPDAIQLKRLREYNKVLREKLLRYRRQWQTSKFYERTAKNGFADIPYVVSENHFEMTNT